MTDARMFSPRRHPLIRAVLAVVLLGMLTIAEATTIHVELDRNPVSPNESLTLTFAADGEPDDDPDFSPLEKDFEVVGQSRNSQVSIVNGSVTRKNEWIVTVIPRHSGDLEIPPIAFGSDRSSPSKVSVKAGSAPSTASPQGGNEPIQLEIEAEPKNPYVQSQVLLTVRLLVGVRIDAANLTDPESPNALIERLGDDRRYMAERNQRRVQIIERRYAVFPQQSGTLDIPPVRFEGRVEDGRSAFGSIFGRGGGRVVRLVSDSVKLEVRPIPAGFTGKHWLPAESLNLTETWSQDPPKFETGEAITRTLTVRAEGATVGALPELAALASVPAEIKQYPDQPAMNEEQQAQGVVSQRQEKTALIPSRPGTLSLPAIEIPWWNTKTDRMEIAKIPERRITVGGVAPAIKPAPPQSDESAPSLAPASPAPQVEVTGGAPFGIWFWLAVFFATGWLATAIAWWLQRPGKPSKPEQADNDTKQLSESAARKAIESACRRHDARAAREALIAWGQVRYPKVRYLGLEALGEQVGGGLAQEIQLLERACFGRTQSEWNGAALWKCLPPPESRTRNASEGLVPLYPN